MKKLLALLLTLVMVLSLVACGASEPTTGKKDPTTKPTTAPTNKPTDPTTVPTEPATAPTEPEVDSNLVSVDNDSFTFRVLSASGDADCYMLTVSAHNKTSALLSFTISNISTNDYVCPDIFVYMDIDAGTEMTEVIRIERTVLDRNGITEPGKVEFNLSAMECTTWTEVYNDACTVYPQGEDSYVDDGGYSAKEGDTVVVDNDRVTVIVTGYEPNNEMGYTVNLYILNKTDVTLTFSMNNVTVNGLMLENYWSADVAAGKRAHCSATWYGTEMTDYNIGDVTMIGFDLSAIDATDWEATDLAGASVTVYPMGEDAAKHFERPEQDTDVVLMDNEYVTITATSISMDADGNFNMVLYIENHADITLFVKPNTVCINGLEKDPYWGATVSAGKATFSTISWYAFALQESDITAVDTISMIMNVFNSDASETFVTEEITITP